MTGAPASLQIRLGESPLGSRTVQSSGPLFKPRLQFSKCLCSGRSALLEASVEPTTSSSPGPGAPAEPILSVLESDLEGLHERTRHQHPDRDCYPHRSPRACRDLGKPEHLPGLQQYLASVRCHRPRGSGLRTLAQGWDGPVSGCSRDSGDRAAADGPVGSRPRCRGTMPGRSWAGRGVLYRE